MRRVSKGCRRRIQRASCDLSIGRARGEVRGGRARCTARCMALQRVRGVCGRKKVRRRAGRARRGRRSGAIQVLATPLSASRRAPRGLAVVESERARERADTALRLTTAPHAPRRAASPAGAATRAMWCQHSSLACACAAATARWAQSSCLLQRRNKHSRSALCRSTRSHLAERHELRPCSIHGFLNAEHPAGRAWKSGACD